MTLGELRSIVAEAPFGDPFKSGPTLRDAIEAVKAARSEHDRRLSSVLADVAKNMKDLKVKDALQKAAGLAQHAEGDLVAVESMVTIAFKRLHSQR